MKFIDEVEDIIGSGVVFVLVTLLDIVGAYSMVSYLHFLHVQGIPSILLR